MRVQPDIQSWLLENGFGQITQVEPVGGGCIHISQIIKTDSGSRFFLKQNEHTPPDMFQKEAQGLNTLRISKGPVVPKVFLVGEKYLLLEDLQPVPEGEDFWQLFGRQLAFLHLRINDKYGFQVDNYIGTNPQCNNWTENGQLFFQTNRYKPQLELAQKKSLLNNQDLRLFELLIERLPDLIPDQPASLLHGDLWSGNLITSSTGLPAVIDPAVYYGWAEADLAMMDLFGSYPTEFYSAYQEIRSLDPDFQSRYPLYNLYHLLNHLNLFGRSYLPQVREILSQFVESTA